MTLKQRRFVELKALGIPNREAAIQAGYSVNSADVTAGKLMMRADIRQDIEDAQSRSVGDTSKEMPRLEYPDALTFLMDAMNHLALPIALRMDAARHLLPYQHARLGEKGKKEQRKENAGHVATLTRFATGRPPKFKSIENGRQPDQPVQPSS